MAQIGDLFARLFGGGTRGLSGDAERVLLDDPELEYFNGRLRRHSTMLDIIDDPSVIWRGGADRRSGLVAQMRAMEEAENLGFTDVLVVVSSDDWPRALQQPGEPWIDRATQVLRGFLEEYCDLNDLHQIFPQRPFGFRFIQDGGSEMCGASLGLEPGQFVTGLLPNHYVGPGTSSRPVISVLLNIPGAWEGYQEVGRLFDDQLQFTLGTHWLDNYCHADLRLPALYRLQQYADGSFVHIVNPDSTKPCQITSHETSEGPAVLTLTDPSGEAIAHMVLAIVEAAAPRVDVPPVDAAAPRVDAPRVDVPPVDAAAPLGAPRRIKAPPPPPPAAALKPPQPAAQTVSSRTFSHGGNRTVIPADVNQRVLTLRETGALFQKVHFARFMDGYNVYLGSNGEVGTTIRDPAAIFEIRGTTISLVPYVDGIKVGDRAIARGKTTTLHGHAEITAGNTRVEFRDLRELSPDGWPYLGEIRRSGGASHMVFGGEYQLGRDRRCKVRLPDEPSNANIVWRPEMAQGGTIRSRSGDIAKSRFYTDSIMVASKHAEISLATEPVLNSLARHCFTYVRRGQDIFALSPTKGSHGPKNMDLQPGDEILIGNCVFAVDYPPADGPRHIDTFDNAVAAPRISPSDLAAAAVGAEAESDAGADGLDLPVAAGLGERGLPPRMPPLTKAGPDSFLGIELPQPVIEPTAPSSKPAPAGIALAGAGVPAPRPRRPVDTPADTPANDDGAANFGSSPPDPPPTDGRTVVEVDEDDWQLELTRPAAFILKGFMVSGRVRVGNHWDAGVVIPENRSEPDQAFIARDYFELFVRGRRGTLTLLDPAEATLLTATGQVEKTDQLQDAHLEIIRRAPDQEEDFRVKLSLTPVPGLPDPRAQFLALSDDDPMARALFTRGLPLRQDHDLTLAALKTTARFDGDAVTLDDYLQSYRRPDGSLRPVFIQQAGGPWRTLPEDGSTLSLRAGDRVLVESALFVLR